MKPPAPGEWHPYYAGKEWLRDWLEGRGPLAGYPDVQVPVVRPIRLSNTDSDDLSEPNFGNTLVMTKRKAWGPAPYVGEPFGYVWPVGVDNLGRCIAGETRIVFSAADGAGAAAA